MLVQYFILKALAKEFDTALRGYLISEVFTQQKNELILTFVKKDDSGLMLDEVSLCISVTPGFNYIVMRRGITRARKNSVSLFSSLNNLSVSNISIHPFDRMLTLVVNNGMNVIIQLYNTASSNIYLVDSSNIIIESFKHSKEVSGTMFKESGRTYDESIILYASTFTRMLYSHKGKNILQALKEMLPQFGTIYIREILHRVSIEETMAVTDGEDYTILWRKVGAISEELQNPAPVIFLNEEGSMQISLVKLTMMKELECKYYKTVNEAVEEILINRFRLQKKENEKQRLMKKVALEIEKIEKALSAIKRQQVNDPSVYEYQAQLILANIMNIKKGMKKVVVSDLNIPHKTVEIQLDPALTPAQNADKYFQKSRKLNKEREEIIYRTGRLEENLIVLKEFEKKVMDAETAGEIKEIVENNKAIQKILNLGKKGEERKPIPFRVFLLENGYEVWVGKSSASNDLLTMKYSAPHDYWFHVRGASGSHTVLKVRKGENVPRDIVQQAAGIAAYYSKMRNASTVPVAYCERKYVRKPKGAASGTVTLEREKVIFVKPELPVSSQR